MKNNQTYFWTKNKLSISRKGNTYFGSKNSIDFYFVFRNFSNYYTYDFFCWIYKFYLSRYYLFISLSETNILTTSYIYIKQFAKLVFSTAPVKLNFIIIWQENLNRLDEKHVVTHRRGQAESRKKDLIWFCLKHQTTQNSVKLAVRRVFPLKPTTICIVEMNTLYISWNVCANTLYTGDYMKFVSCSPLSHNGMKSATYLELFSIALPLRNGILVLKIIMHKT